MLPDAVRALVRNYLAGNPYRGRPDDEVWDAVRATDPEDPAFGQALCVLLERCGGEVFAACRRHPGAADSEDLFQETVLALLRRRPVGVTSFARARGWLCRVARNKAVDAARRRAPVGPVGTPLVVHPDDGADAAGLLDEVLVAVANLGEKYRVPFRLFHIDGLTHDQIAHRLGLTPAAVQKRVERGRARVVAALARRGLAPATAGILIQTMLADAGRAAVLPPERAAAIAETILAKAAALPPIGGGVTAWLVGAAVLLGGGVSLGGWAVTTDGTPAETPQVLVQRRPVALPEESVPDRNLRVFLTEVLQRQLGALKGLVIGDGDVVLRSAEAYDVRLDCTYGLRHRGGGRPGWVSVIRLVHHTYTGDPDRPRPSRQTEVYFDLFGRGEWRPIDPDRPIILWRNPLTGGELVARAPPLQAAMAAFDPLPRDGRTEAEFRAVAARMDAAVGPLLGTWYARGDRHAARWITLEHGAVTFACGYPFIPDLRLYTSGRLNPAGRLAGLRASHFEVTFSADGHRVDFRNQGEWWAREPVSGRGR